MMVRPSDRPIPWVAVVGGPDINPASSAVEGDLPFCWVWLSTESGAAAGYLACRMKRRVFAGRRHRALTMKLEAQDSAKPETSEL